MPFDLTVDEFFDWCPEDGNRWELIDGEPLAMAPPGHAHGAVQSAINAILFAHLAVTRPDCAVVTTPGIIPPVKAGANFRVPDLGVTCAPVAANDRSMRNPVLLIEILSPSNRRETWANVWAYTTIPSVREFLVLHSDQPRAELLRRG